MQVRKGGGACDGEYVLDLQTEYFGVFISYMYENRIIWNNFL